MKKSNRKWSLFFMIISIFLMVLAGCSSSNTSSEGNAKSDFPKRDIEFVVGYEPGGGYSDWVQAIAPFIKKYLPNEVNVKVRHMDGAGGAIAANYIQKAKPDGYTIGIYNLGGLAALQQGSDVDFDLSKATWLGRLSLDPTIVTVNAKSEIKGIEDFKEEKEVIMATKGLAANATITGAVTFDKLGVNWQPLNHSGTSETILSVIRGDADVTWGSLDSQKQYIENGDLRMILYYDSERHPEYPDVPIPSDVGMAEINEAFNTHRIVGAPENLPDDVKDILEEAIKKAVEDPEFQDVLKKREMSSSYLNSKDTEKLVTETLTSFKAYKDVVNDLMSKDQ